MTIFNHKIQWTKKADPYVDDVPDNEVLRLQQLIELLKTSAESIASATSSDDSIMDALRLICLYTGWEVGHAYYIGKDATEEDPCPRLMPTKFWFMTNPHRFKEFKIATENKEVENCDGIIGQVFAAKQYVVNHIDGQGAYLNERKQIALQLGLVSVFAFPVMTRNKISTILEFYSTRHIKIEADLLNALAHIGFLLGNHLEQKWAEDALRTSEQRFRSVFETATDGIIIGGPSGDIIGMNSAAYKIFGYENTKGKLISDLMPERYKHAHREGLHRVAAGGESILKGRSTELVGLRANGEEFPIELTLGDWVTGKSRFFCGFVRDLTDSHAKEKELTHSADSLLRQADILTYILDLTTEGIVVINEEGHIVFLNKSGLELLGVSYLEDEPRHFDHVCEHVGTLFKEDKTTPYTKDEIPIYRALAGEEIKNSLVFVRNSEHPDGIMLSVMAGPLREKGGHPPIGAIAILKRKTDMQQL